MLWQPNIWRQVRSALDVPSLDEADKLGSARAFLETVRGVGYRLVEPGTA